MVTPNVRRLSGWYPDVLRMLASEEVSFEIGDIDNLQMGYEALKAGGYRLIWGIGRHLQGSQIFDYWLNPFGTMYEHRKDTALLNASMPKSIHRMHKIATPWGPDIPDDFLHQGTA